MKFDFFGWITKSVEAAILKGIDNAAARIAGGDEPEGIAGKLARRLQALPPPAEGNGHGHEEGGGPDRTPQAGRVIPGRKARQQ
jgi:hypothetical protein